MRSYLKRTSGLVLTASLIALASGFAHGKNLDPLPGAATHLGPMQPALNSLQPPVSGTWTPLAHAFPGPSGPDLPLLLTDGSVIVHEACTEHWYKLRPNAFGSYVNSVWTPIADMPAGYRPLYFASQVLRDGRVMIQGGEYISCNPVWSNLGALYNPVTNTWTNVPPPAGWPTVGDAQSVMRPDGHYMVANCCNPVDLAIATITGTTVTWTIKNQAATGKAVSYNEENWTLLRDTRILTIDANRDLAGNFSSTELLSTVTNTWTTGNPTISRLVDTNSHEVGPGVLLPNNFVFVLGGTSHTGIFNPATGTWAAGPDLPNINGALTSADGPAAVMPNGRVLAQVSPGIFQSPSHFFEVDVTSATAATLTQVNEPAQAPIVSSYEGRMLVLPTGQVLWTSDRGGVELYTPVGGPLAGWRPAISTFEATVTRGTGNHVVTGLRLTGLTEGGYYGDDAQTSTNYPLVRFINNTTRHVCYGRTYNFSRMGISNGATTSFRYTIPRSCELGASTMQVVTNGIASLRKAVTIQ
jgi:hypothetical protein